MIDITTDATTRTMTDATSNLDAAEERGGSNNRLVNSRLGTSSLERIILVMMMKADIMWK